MSRRKVKITDRLLAMLLSVMMVVAMLPTTIFPVMAATEEETESFTLTVSDGMASIEGAVVTLSSSTGQWSEDLETTTDENGIASFSATDISKALDDGTGSITYTIKIAGYFTKTDVIEITTDDLEDNTDVQLVKGTDENAFKVTIKDKESQELLNDAEVVLMAKEGEEWSLNLVGITDEDGVAWFDKSTLITAVPNDGEPNITYIVSCAGYETVSESIEASTVTSSENLDVQMDKMPEDTFDILIKDNEAQLIEGVEIVLCAKEGENWTLNLSASTLENGVASFSKSEIEQALAASDLQGGTIKYIARCNNYYTVTDEIEINTVATLDDEEIIMKQITEEDSFKLVVKEDEQVIEGAEVVLNAKENTWTLNLVATTDENGIAWFDKDAIKDVLPLVGDANIAFIVSFAGYKNATGNIPITDLDSEYNVSISKVEVESFKVLVKDTEGVKAGATVVLTSKEGEAWTLNLTTTTDENGVAWFTKEDISNVLPDDGDWTMVYTVTLADYRTVTGEVIVSEDTLVQTVNVDLVKIVSNTLNVNVTKGQATVKLNGTEQDSITVSNAVVDGEYVTVEIEPTEGYIKTLTINGANQDLTGINKGDAYTNTIKVDAETIIEVEIVKEYTVTVNSEAGQGTVKVNGQADVFTFDEGSNISITVEAAEGYQISSVLITGINDIEITDKYEFVYEGIVVNSDIVVNVTYVKVYTVTINYNENGTVSIDRGETEGGSVVVNTGENAVIEDGKTVTLIADPSDNFRVSEVWIDGVKDESISNENYSVTDVYSKVLTPDKSFTVSIVFAPNRYEVTKTDTENGSIILGDDVNASSVLVNHDGSCHVSVRPSEGYCISGIQVDGVDYNNVVEDEEYEGGVIFTLQNITKNTTVSATFTETPAIEIEIDELFNDEDAIRLGEREFIFENIYDNKESGKSIQFSTSKDGIRITYLDSNGNGKRIGKNNINNIQINETAEIIRIEIYEHGFIYGVWKEVKDTSLENSLVSRENPLKIIIDNGGLTSTITPSQKHSEEFYNDDFDVSITASDDYSGISKIEYFVTRAKEDLSKENYDYVYSDINITKTQSGVLYTHGYQINDSITKSVTVDAQLNNTDFVSVWFKITDRAGNVTYDRTDYFKVNCTPPELTSVDVSGESHLEAQAGYYYKDVTVTVKFADRASSFNKSNECFTITENGQVIEIDGNSVIINWIENGDELIATIKFVKDAKYSLAINYTNAANKAMVIAEGVSSDHSFTVDKTAPEGTITFDEETIWKKILETLTFGFWSDEEITATAEISYDVSETYDILYYMSDTTTLLTEGELEAIYDADNSSFTNEKITVSTEGKYIIYARLTDYAGNTRYISTEGTIIEDTDSEITVIPSETANGNGFYNKDVILNVTVKDKLDDTDDLYSGIKTIDYYVIKDGVESELTNLYTFNKKSPKYEELTTDWTGNITIKANEYNSDNVKVVVVAEDNAGNKKINDECTLKINVDEVKATLTMDGVANKVIDEHGYFKVDKRTATITVIDRLSAFDSNIATDAVNITAVDKDGNEILNAYEISDWESKDGKHTATVTFNSNAIYTWSFDYTNKADNTLLANNFDTEDVQTPFSFTIDNVAPKGVVKVNDNAWDKLLNVLTFGYYDKVKAEVSAEASDNISPFIIEYYKTSNVNPMTESELEDVEFKSYAPFSVSGNEQFVVYVKISDYAGNCTYISSAGHVIDEAKSTITLTQSQTDALYNASDDVKVNVLVEDAEPYSGIKLVEYWIVNNGVKTQGEAIYTFDETNPTYDKLMKTWTGVITVDKSKNNSNDVEVYVRTVDNANNEETKSTKLAIDTVKPSISVKFDNGNDNNGNSYFDDKRVATVVITERAEQFDKNAATNGILINAVDAEGNKVNDAYTISGWTTSVNAENPDASTHIATITFAKDANYTWSISYTDKAGNVNSAVTTSVVNGTSVAPFDFTVDTVAPTGTLQAVSAEGKKAEWNALRPNLTFGFVSIGKITVSGTFDDVTSESPYKIEYYKVKATAAKDGTTALTEKDLNAVKNWTSLITKQQTNEYGKYYSFGDVVASKDEQFVVYVKLTDLAGNVKYLGTNGLIVDHTAPSEETLAPEVTMTQKAPVNGVYKDDVSVEIKVVDPLIGGTYSGLESVTYKVLSMGKETQTGELFAFKIQDPKQSELVQTWTGKIVVDSELNNSNNVQVVVYATDKAGNQSSKTLTLKIDTTAPVIDIEYNNNNGETSYVGETLFKEDRVATIKVTERNFNGSKVVINVTNTDGSKPVLSNWTVFKNGTGNGDDTVYMATLTYNADGDYKFDIKYEDEAENVCTDIDYGNSLAPTEFTIDKTLPIIQVSYDNNNVSNGNYYNQDRTATVTVTEHNFDESRYVLTIIATDNGVAAQIPTAGQWTSNGDVHRMTIPFTKDAHYTIDIEFTDKAGNIASDFAEQNFFIDKTNPTLSISGVANESANNAGEVGLVITATDTNMDVFEPDIYAVIVTDDSYDTEHFNIGKRQNITNGIKYTVSNLDKDGMYKVECNLVDKAGNVYSEVLLYKSDDTSYTEQKTVGDVLLTFSVNREGSVYEVNDVTEKLIKDTYVQSISDDLAIVEVNADELVEYQVILNGKALTEDVDFTVVKEGGNGQWYKYTYLVNKSLFEADGEYELVISSKDRAFNSAFSDVKGRTITFVVDTTEPVVAVSGLESNGRYKVTEQAVTLVPTDDGGYISKVLVGYADKSGNIYQEIFSLSGEELIKALEEGQGKLSFVIKEGLDKDIKIMCWDSAFDSEGNANVYEKIYTGVSVSTSQIAMLWASDAIRNAIIISAVVVVVGIIAIIVIRKTRKNKR